MNEHQKKDSGADKKIKRLARKPPGFIRQEKSRPLACFFALIARLTLGPLRFARRLFSSAAFWRLLGMKNSVLTLLEM
jgi:hypothetical protein